MKFEPTPVPEGWKPPEDSETLQFSVYPEDWVPRLTAEEAERGTVFVQLDDGRFVEAHTIVDPETGGVYVEPKGQT